MYDYKKKHRGEIESDLAWIRSRFGHPRTEDARDPVEVAVAVTQGDGKLAEAVAAVMYWSDMSMEDALELVGGIRQNWHTKPSQSSS